MTRQDALVAYVNLVTELDPTWQEKTDITHDNKKGKGGGGGGGGPVVSTLMREEEEISDKHKSVFDWCREGNVNRLAAMVTKAEVNTVDEEVCTLPNLKVLYHASSVY